MIQIWHLDEAAMAAAREGGAPPPAAGGNLAGGSGAEPDEGSEIWRTEVSLRGHRNDIYDLAWAPDSCHLISGSIDNTAIVWNVRTGKPVHHLRDHSHYVQGVAWHPLNKFVATQSCDRLVKGWGRVTGCLETGLDLATFWRCAWTPVGACACMRWARRRRAAT